MNDQRPRNTPKYNRQLTISELKELALGRWIEILSAAGIADEILDGRGRPCPKCGGRDRFAAWRDVADRGAVHCRKCFTTGTRHRPGDGIATLCWLMDCNVTTACRWLADYLGAGSSPSRKAVRSIVQRVPICRTKAPVNFLNALASDSHHSISGKQLRVLADELNVSTEALASLRVGWNAEYNASTWPMVDTDSNVVGIRLRYANHRKCSVKGGTNGLFVPSEISPQSSRLWICEGATDCAALLTLGLDAIGISSANSTLDRCTNYAMKLAPKESVVVADADDAGRRSADKLACLLVTVCPVRIIFPADGCKDAREWVAKGASTSDLQRAADTAVVRKLSVIGGTVA